MKWGLKSMIWYVFILVIIFFIALFNYFKLVNDPIIKSVFF